MIPSKKEWADALIDRHGTTLYERFSSATVAICGLGGLGSNIAIALARAGIGKLLLIDFDHVEITNLHRQQYKANQIGLYKAYALAENLLEIAPYTEIQAVTAKITEENFTDILQDADIVCEAFDNAESKAMLVNGVLEQLPQWGVSQILCKHRRAVKNRAKLFLGVAVYPPSLKFYIGKSFCACQGQRLESRCSFSP